MRHLVRLASAAFLFWLSFFHSSTAMANSVATGNVRQPVIYSSNGGYILLFLIVNPTDQTIIATGQFCSSDSSGGGLLAGIQFE
jgi:hypothetical protein